MELQKIERLLVAGITPYFLEKGRVWFEENFKEIQRARKTQPFFQEQTLVLEQNQKRSLSELLRKLDELGYEKVLRVAEPGEFASRGGIVDVFPINTANALRIEFKDNTIESIQALEALFQDEEKTKAVLKKRLS